MLTAPNDHYSLREAVREHYDALLSSYTLLWGEHIHHGYWDGPASPAAAQERLVAELAGYAGIEPGSRVADIGCGIGGSSRWLARRRGCRMTALTISFRQVEEARRRGRSAARWLQADAASLPLRTGSHDAAWIVECSEHLLDRTAFFRECARVVRPGGRLALAAWLRMPGAPEDLLTEVELAMLIGPLQTPEESRDTLLRAGWERPECRDVTERVRPTWDLCVRVTEQPMVRSLVRAQPEPVRRFVASFPLMQRAFREGAMSYALVRSRRRD